MKEQLEGTFGAFVKDVKWCWLRENAFAVESSQSRKTKIAGRYTSNE